MISHDEARKAYLLLIACTNLPRGYSFLAWVETDPVTGVATTSVRRPNGTEITVAASAKHINKFGLVARWFESLVRQIDEEI